MIAFAKTTKSLGSSAGAGRISLKRAVALATLTLTPLAGCGGGGGESGQSTAPPVTVTPSPTPMPTPSPAPTGTPIFGSLGQTTSQSFATLGFSYSGVEVGGWGDLAIEATSVDANLPIGFRFLAPAQLLLSLDGLGEGALIPNGGSGTDHLGLLNQLSYQVLGGNASLSLIRLPSGEYVMGNAVGNWTSAPSSGARAVYRVAQFAYGVPTATGQVPETGTASYDAQIFGSVALASPGGEEVGYYSGTARLSVDFGTRVVSGTIDIAPATSGTYTLTSTVLKSDGTGFFGRLTSGEGGAEGFIEGRLTGSSAREMIVRWRAPVNIGGRSGLAFGVWVGVVGQPVGSAPAPGEL